MRILGKWAILTHDELEKIKDLSYQRGLRSKWKKNETERLLAAIAPSVVIPSRNAETYEKPKAGILDVMKMTWVGPDDPTPSSTIDVRSYGDSLPITAGELLSEINPQQDAA